MNNPAHWPLAKGTVNHVGDPVAVVLGDDRYAVVDATEDVVVEYESLPVVTDPEKALEGPPYVHDELGTNKVHEWSLPGGDVEAGFAQADVIVERRVINHRTAGAPIEPRGVLADYRAGQLTVWTSTQVPHFVRLFLAILLGMSEERVRVIAPEVGGGFGSKLQVYGEEVLAAWASRKLERPIKWIETRSENMAAAHQGRDQIAHVKMGAKRDGTVTAFHVKIVADFGAYNMLLTPLIPSLGAFVMGGCYAIPNVQTDIVGVFTNKAPTDAIRGAGRPEATHMIEVTLDQMAAELGMDPVEIRRKNFIPSDSFPAAVATGVIYDSGDYNKSLDRLLEHIDLDGFRNEQQELRSQGIHRGIGFSTYTEICGLAPSRVTGPGGVGVQAGGWESSMVRVNNTGAVTVYTGSSGHGQGHETAFAQIVADRLGVDPAVVEVLHGDTGVGPEGRNTYGSRSLAVGGEALAKCSIKVADMAKAIVAHQLEAATDDIELKDDKFSVRGSPDKGMTLAEVAGAAYLNLVPDGMEPGLEETTFYDPENFVFPFGAHACIVDVDADTGKVKVIRYVAVDDCGKPINPLLIDGQVHGGIVHAIGQALYERVQYDEDGPTRDRHVRGRICAAHRGRATELRDRPHGDAVSRQLARRQGRRRGGTIAASPAVTNAVIDALRPLGVSYMNMPLTPMRVWEAIQEASSEVCPHDPRRVRLRWRPRRSTTRSRRYPTAARDAKLLAGGHSVLPLDEAAARHASAARGPPEGSRASTGWSAPTAAGGSAR